MGDLNPQQVEYLLAITTSGSHLNRLVDNLLETSRLDRAVEHLEIEPVQPAAVWFGALETLRPLADAKEVALEIVGGEGAPAVQGNPRQADGGGGQPPRQRGQVHRPPDHGNRGGAPGG